MVRIDPGPRRGGMSPHSPCALYVTTATYSTITAQDLASALGQGSKCLLNPTNHMSSNVFRLLRNSNQEMIVYYLIVAAFA